MLFRSFPNVQFIVTSHSPSVINHLQSKHTRLLSDKKIYGVGDTEGQSVDVILEDIMDTDASKFRHEFAELFEAISKNDMDKAKKLRRELEEEVEGKHPELIKANGLIRKKELLNQ